MIEITRSQVVTMAHSQHSTRVAMAQPQQHTMVANILQNKQLSLEAKFRQIQQMQVSLITQVTRPSHQTPSDPSRTCLSRPRRTGLPRQPTKTRCRCCTNGRRRQQQVGHAQNVLL